ncbi:hypothetical protein ACOI1H_13495 [Loktanella sp. DJP18]|uniref:hypothetical protein n=1 Tax=Loktanella sp. DJP18 TaxID=3409788 RepID=UPI003BB4B30F
MTTVQDIIARAQGLAYISKCFADAGYPPIRPETVGIAWELHSQRLGCDWICPEDHPAERVIQILFGDEVWQAAAIAALRLSHIK